MKDYQIKDWLEDNLQDEKRSMLLENGERMVYLSDVKKLVADEFAEPEDKSRFFLVSYFYNRTNLKGSKKRDVIDGCAAFETDGVFFNFLELAEKVTGSKADVSSNFSITNIFEFASREDFESFTADLEINKD